MEYGRLIKKVLRKSKYEEDLEMLCKYWPDYQCQDCGTYYKKVQPPFYECHHCGSGEIYRVEKEKESAVQSSTEQSSEG